MSRFWVNISETMGLGCLNLTHKNNAIIDTAISKGIILFDTSDCYGQDYESEKALGEKLKEHASERKDLIVCTKVGVQFNVNGLNLNGRPDYILASCDASLMRLQTSYIDIYYLHRVDPEVLFEDSIRAFKRLVDTGKVKKIGLSEVTENQIRRAHAIHPISVVQIEYSPWSRDDENNGVFDTCRELGIQIIAYSPLGRAFFTDAGDKSYFETLPEKDFRRLIPRYGKYLDENLKAKELLKNYASENKMTLIQLVLAWSIKNNCIPIPEMLNSVHLEENSKARDVFLTDRQLQEINSILAQCQFMGPRYPSREVSGIYPEKESIPNYNENNLFVAPPVKGECPLSAHLLNHTY